MNAAGTHHLVASPGGYFTSARRSRSGTEFKQLRAQGEVHPIEQTGRELRTLMAWVKSHDSDSDYVEGTATR